MTCSEKPFDEYYAEKSAVVGCVLGGGWGGNISPCEGYFCERDAVVAQDTPLPEEEGPQTPAKSRRSFLRSFFGIFPK